MNLAETALLGAEPSAATAVNRSELREGRPAERAREGVRSVKMKRNIEKCSFHEAPGANAMRTAGHEAPSCFLVRLHIWLALTYILFACQENVTIVFGRRVSLLSNEKNGENTTKGHLGM